MLAGFPDQLADEGPAAGPASLVGLGIARDQGWSAPGTATRGRPGSTLRDGSSVASSGTTAETATEAVEQADTSRAETETKAEEGHQ